MIESRKEIGKIIRDFRKDRKLSMKQLGAMIGVSEQAISQYELGKRDISAEQLKLIAAALNIPKSILLTDLNDVVAIEEKPPSERTPEEHAIYNYFVSGKIEKEKPSAISVEEKEKAFLMGIQIGKLLASGKPLDANLLNSIGVENDTAAILAQYFQLDENSRDQVFKALEKSLNCVEREGDKK